MTKETYKISQRTLDNAKRLGVEVRPSTVKGKKIDVFKAGKKVASVGAISYNDYTTFLQLEQAGELPAGTAEKRRKAYEQRHPERKFIGTPGWYAYQLLWM